MIKFAIINAIQENRNSSIIVHPDNEYGSRQHLIAGLKVEAVFSE
jgi:hypothetical protein